MIKRGPILSAFLDESGKFSNKEVVGLAGLVGESQHWHEFQTKWLARLTEDGLNYSSMKNALYFTGEFESWRGDELRRDALLHDLCQLILEQPLLRIVAIVKSSDFKRLPEVEQKRLGNDPIYAAFEGMVVQILASAPDATLHICYDLSEEYSEKCVKLFHKLRVLVPLAKDRCAAIAFADDTLHAGIQAADMMASCLRSEHTPSESPAEIVLKLAERFRTQGRRVYNQFVYSILELGQGELHQLETGVPPT